MEGLENAIKEMKELPCEILRKVAVDMAADVTEMRGNAGRPENELFPVKCHLEKVGHELGAGTCE